MTIAVQVILASGNSLQASLSGIKNLVHAPRHELAEGIARMVQEQTRERIENDKTAPDGTAWKANRAGTSILFRSGSLSRSIDYAATPDEIKVGSGLLYARIHHLGGTIKAKDKKSLAFYLDGKLIQVKSVEIPARPYLGLSAENQQDIIDAGEDWITEIIQ